MSNKSYNIQSSHSNSKKSNYLYETSKTNRTNKTNDSKSQKSNKSKSKDSKSKKSFKLEETKESNKLNGSIKYKKSSKKVNSNNFDKSNELNKLMEQKYINDNETNHNTSVMLNKSYIKNNNKFNSLTRISNNFNYFKSNKEVFQVFIDYKTFIKGKPYSELGKEYKQGIEIGERGFGKILTIIHKKMGQLRAMKLIKKSKEFNLDEIDNLILLNHPNILKLYEYFYDEKENIYIITEYICGEELFNKIQEVVPFSEEDSTIIIKSVLQAITYCHSRGIIPRDL